MKSFSLRRAVSTLCLVTLFVGGGIISAQNAALASPSWLRHGVIYEVFPRAFSSNGDFNGITARLDDLKGLGIDILWLMPIHPIGQKMRKGDVGSPYAVKDYYAINPDYGSADDLKRLITQAHRRDMKVIMDLVANHTAWDCVLMSHPDFYKQDADGHILPPNPAWSDVAGLNYANPQLRRYMIAMMKYWIDPSGFDFDGFRCDVAGDVPTSFWEEARAELLKVKPDIILLAEASKPDLMVKAFDVDYSWPLLSALNRVMLDGAPALDLQQSWEQTRREFPPGALHMRISDDHDEARAVARYGIRGALAASALMFTLDGVPLLYNGMEAGDATESGDPALFEKIPVFWHPKARPDLPAIYSSLIYLRKKFAPFQNDCVTWLHASDATNTLSFMRRDESDEFVVVINFSNRPQKTSVDVDHAGDFRPVKIAGMPDAGADNLTALNLPGFGWRIYHRSVVKAAGEQTQLEHAKLTE